MSPARVPAVHAERLAAQRLAVRPATTPEEVVESLLAVQAQDRLGMRLAVRCRSVGLSAADLDAACTERRSLLVAWLNRGTLHLVTPADYWWLAPLTTPQLRVSNERRLRQEGVSPAQAERGIEVVAAAVAAGPRTRPELRALLDDAGVPTAGQAFVHVLYAAALAAEVVRGPVVDGQHAFVAARQWFGPPPAPLVEEEGLARLARRYLVAHGPADAADLARWAGIALGAARRGLAAISEEVEQRPDGLVQLPGSLPGAVPPPMLLGPFDPLLLGWTSRVDVVGEHRGLVTNNGIFRPVALVDGRAVGTWSLAQGRLTLRLLEPVRAATVGRLSADALAVLRYLGLPERPAVVVQE